MQAGAIYGRLLTAWTAAGVLGPVPVNYIREYQIDAGVPRAEALFDHDVYYGGTTLGGIHQQPDDGGGG